MVASTFQGNQEKTIVEDNQKQVSTNSRDQEMFDREYKERQYNNQAGNRKIPSLDNQGEVYGQKLMWFWSCL